MGEHAKQVQSVWVVGVDAQDLPIDRFGLRQASRLMVLQGGGKQGGHGG
jgi:hypothetical protein